MLQCWSCAKDTVFKTFPEGPIHHHLIVLAKTKTGIKARGFSGATPPATQIFCEAGHGRQQVTSNADGSFSLEVQEVDPKVTAGELTFTTGGKHYQQGYQIRDLAQDLENLTHQAFNCDKEVDDISFSNDRVAILSSQAALVRTFEVDQYFRLGQEPKNSVLLNQKNAVSLYPASLAFVDQKVAVSLNLSHEVALFNIDNGTILDQAKVEDHQGQPLRINLSTPLEVKHPIDADESGTASTTIRRTIARNPEAIFAIDNQHFLVSFTNYYQYEDESRGQKSVVGPGMVVLMAIENGKIKTKAHEVLDFKNPHYFLAIDQKNVWVVSVGEWVNIGKSTIFSNDAGLTRLQIATDHKSFTISQKLALTNFAPARPAVVGSKLVIPHFDMNEIAVVDQSATTINDQDKKKPQFHRDFGFTFAAHWHDDIVFLGDKQGSLVAFSLSEGFFPFPFVEPVIIDKNIDERIGLRPQMIYFRHQVQNFDVKAHYPPGFSAWVLSSSQHKIYPMMLGVFGP